MHNNAHLLSFSAHSYSIRHSRLILQSNVLRTKFEKQLFKHSSHSLSNWKVFQQTVMTGNFPLQIFAVQHEFASADTSWGGRCELVAHQWIGAGIELLQLLRSFPHHGFGLHFIQCWVLETYGSEISVFLLLRLQFAAAKGGFNLSYQGCSLFAWYCIIYSVFPDYSIQK